MEIENSASFLEIGCVSSAGVEGEAKRKQKTSKLGCIRYIRRSIDRKIADRDDKEV